LFGDGEVLAGCEKLIVGGVVIFDELLDGFASFAELTPELHVLINHLLDAVAFTEVEKVGHLVAFFKEGVFFVLEFGDDVFGFGELAGEVVAFLVGFGKQPGLLIKEFLFGLKLGAEATDDIVARFSFLVEVLLEVFFLGDGFFSL